MTADPSDLAQRGRGPVNRVSFDEQAHRFEARAGLPDGVPEQVAEAVRDYAQLGEGDLLVEIGAGTGLIGQWLARQPIRYLGLDSSQPMLDLFAPRLPTDGRAELRHADANQRWPVADGSARAIFGSRVFQLLDIDHLIREAHRVGAPQRAVLVQGRLLVDPHSPKTVARAKLAELYAAHGLRTRPAERLLQRVLDKAVGAGGRLLPARPVASWLRAYPPAEVLDDWAKKWSMGGITPPRQIKEEVMRQLAAWAAETYGDPTRPVATEEQYVLEGVLLHPLPEQALERSQEAM